MIIIMSNDEKEIVGVYEIKNYSTENFKEITKKYLNYIFLKESEENKKFTIKLNDYDNKDDFETICQYLYLQCEDIRCERQEIEDFNETEKDIDFFEDWAVENNFIKNLECIKIDNY